MGLPIAFEPGIPIGPVFANVPTPLQETLWLYWTVFLLALAVGLVYIFLLLWGLSRFRGHEPRASDQPYEPPPPEA
jgi:hypothetical protein